MSNCAAARRRAYAGKLVFNAGEQAHYTVHPPGLEHMAGYVAGRTVEHCMTKGQQTHIADQQVERRGQQREAHQLHQEHRVHEERCDRGERDGSGQQDHGALPGTHAPDVEHEDEGHGGAQRVQPPQHHPRG